MPTLWLLAQDAIPLPSNFNDLLLGNIGLTVYLLWRDFDNRREIKAVRDEFKAERDLLETEGREMTKKALDALDAVSRRGGGV